MSDQGKPQTAVGYERAMQTIEAANPDLDLCEHGVKDGEWCSECSAEYKLASERYDKEMRRE